MPVVYLFFLNNNKEVKNKFEEVSKSALIIQSIKNFVQEKLRTSKGCYKKDDREAMMAILTVSMNNLGNLAKKNNMHEAIGMSKKLFNTSLKNNKPANENYKHKKGM